MKSLVLDSSDNSVAVNRMFYDFDPTNDPNAPLQCSGCTASRVNNAAATDTDSIRQESLRNEKRWLFAGIMSSELVALVILRNFVRDSSGLCRDGDCNADASFKVATYGPSDFEGIDAAAALRKYADRLHPNPPTLIEQLFHPRDADAGNYEWSNDFASLVDALDKTGSGAIALPDLVAISTYAQFYVPVVRLFPSSRSKIRFVQTDGFRTESVLQALGSIGEGREGVSHVPYERDASGETFEREFSRFTGLAPGTAPRTTTTTRSP